MEILIPVIVFLIIAAVFVPTCSVWGNICVNASAGAWAILAVLVIWILLLLTLPEKVQEAFFKSGLIGFLPVIGVWFGSAYVLRHYVFALVSFSTTTLTAITFIKVPLVIGLIALIRSLLIWNKKNDSSP